VSTPPTAVCPSFSPEKEVRGGYLLITPACNEEHNIGRMLTSVLAQKVLPRKWIIVDDGSTDRTAEIVEQYAREHPFIELIHFPRRQTRLPGGENAVNRVLRQTDVSCYEFFSRFDADLVLEPDYISRILGEFRRDKRLGIAGGGLYIQKNARLELEEVPEYHVRGALKMYRHECFKDLGGLESCIGWDTIDEVSAWIKGWTTRSFVQYRVIHLRPTGEGIRARHLYWQRGKAEYYTWSHPFFVLCKAVKIAFSKAGLVPAICLLGGFGLCYLKCEERLDDPQFRKARRDQQIRRIFAIGGKEML